MKSNNDVKVFGLEAKKGRWIFVAIGIVIYICLGTIYSYSVFKIPLQDFFDISSTEGNLPFMFNTALAAVGIMIAGKLLLKYNPRTMTLIGGISIGLGYILSGLLPRILPNIWTLVFTYSILAGLGVSFIYGVPLAIANRWFPDKRGLVMGITLAGFGGSPIITANIAAPLIEKYGPLSTFVMLGVVFLCVIVALSFFLRYPPENWNPDGEKEKKIVSSSVYNRKQMMKTSSFAGIFLAFGIGSLAGFMAIGIASPVGVELANMSAVQAGSMVGIFALFNAGGRTLFGWLTDKLTPKKAAVIALSVTAVAGILMSIIPASVAVYTFCFCLFWLGYGGWLAIAPVTTTAYFGLKYYTENYGVVFIANGIGSVFGNILSGKSKDIFGDYQMAFIVTAGLAVIGIITSIIFLKPPRKSIK